MQTYKKTRESHKKDCHLQAQERLQKEPMGRSLDPGRLATRKSIFCFVEAMESGRLICISARKLLL